MSQDNRTIEVVPAPAQQQEREEKAEAQAVAAAKQKEEEVRVAALLEAAPPEEREALRQIYLQEQKNMATDEDTADFIESYKRLPEKYGRHIAYLEELQNLKPIEQLSEGNEKTVAQRQMVQVFASLSEVYLSQYAVDFRRDSLELADTFYALANHFLKIIISSVGKTGPISLYVPLYMQAMLAELKEKVEAAKGAVMTTDAEQLKIWLRTWPYIKAQDNLLTEVKVIQLTRIVYLCGKLEQYSLQAAYLEELAEMIGTTDTAATVQAKLLLSDLYYRLEQLEKAEQSWQTAEALYRMFNMQIRVGNHIVGSDIPHDRAFFEGMLDIYLKQLEAAKARAIEAQRMALPEVSQEEEELDEEALLAQAMAMSLQEEEQLAAAEGEGLEGKVQTLPFSTTDALIPLPSATVERSKVQVVFQFHPSGTPLMQGLFGASARGQQIEEIKQESRALALVRGNIGPSELPGGELQDVEKDGNCFYAAVVLELEKSEGGRAFLQTTPEGVLDREWLRRHIQGKNAQEVECAGEREIGTLVCDPALDVVVMIVDTRYPDSGFVYHYKDEEGKHAFGKLLPAGIEGKTLVRLAFTGDHYLSVTRAPWDAPLPSVQGGPR